jgi:hypothetical protein
MLLYLITHFTFETEEGTPIAIAVKVIIFFETCIKWLSVGRGKGGERKTVNMFTCDSQEFRRERDCASSVSTAETIVISGSNNGRSNSFKYSYIHYRRRVMFPASPK